MQPPVLSAPLRINFKTKLERRADVSVCERRPKLHDSPVWPGADIPAPSAPSGQISSSARVSTEGDTVRPNVLAVLSEAGGLMAYGTELGEVFRQAARSIDKILKGANPGDIPFYLPTKFELVINLE